MNKLKICVSILFLLITVQCNTRHNNYPAELDQLIPGATLIFKAKILLLHTLTTDEDNPADAGVVEVTDVIEAPKPFPDIKGQQITVRFTDIKNMKPGDEKMFFTDPYWLGESIGVKEIGSVTKSSTLYESKDLLSFIQQARNNQDDKKMKKQLHDAKQVVTGKVIKVMTPGTKQIMASEHDPEWREAEIQIDETLKGNADAKTMKILFASSNDVMYYRAPKFKEGDEGIFIIPPADSLVIKLVGNNNVLLDASGFIRGKEKTAHIKSLLK